MPPRRASVALAAATLFTSRGVRVRAAPCDIYGAAGTPCAAAHSMVRALFVEYGAPLYQLQRSGDNATLDVAPIGAGGVADAAAHAAFCAANPAPPPPPPPPPGPLPPLGTVVSLAPLAIPGYAFRHCYSQGFVTRAADSGADHAFTLVAALAGQAGAVSFESTNFPGQYIAPLSGVADAGRAGIVAAPAPLDASWVAAPAASGGVTLTSLAPAHRGLALAVGADLTGTCAHSYAAPSASVRLAAAPSAWVVAPAAPGPYPRRAACVVAKIYDQTGNGNHLLPATPGINNPAFDNPVNATRHAVTAGGRAVYGAYFESGMGYRAQNTTRVAVGNEPETVVLVTSGTHVNGECCLCEPRTRARARDARGSRSRSRHPRPLRLAATTATARTPARTRQLSATAAWRP